MILCLKAIDSQQQPRRFCCTLKSIEAAFDTLNRLVKSGSILLEASLIDEQVTTRLPGNAFEGASFGQSIQALQQQWEAILDEPIRDSAPSYHSEMAVLAHRSLEVQRQKIIMYTHTITWFDYLLQQAQTSFHYEPRRSILINRYTAKINDNQVKLASVLIAYALLQERYQGLGTNQTTRQLADFRASFYHLGRLNVDHG